MNIFKKASLLCVILFTAISGYGQLIRYVSYYPVPSVTHSQLTVSGQAVLGALGGGRIDVGASGIDSGLVVSSFEANRLVLTGNANSDSSQNLNIGSLTAVNTTKTGSLKSTANISVVDNMTNINTIESSGMLSLKGIYWPAKGGIGATKDGDEDWENCPEGAELKWVSLRLGGSDDFKTYLVCGVPSVKDAPQCDPAVYQCKSTENLLGNPVMGTCRCVEDCSKRTDGRSQITEGGLCCKPGQITKTGPYGKFCTFVFTQSTEWVYGVAPTTSSPSTQTCGSMRENACDAESGYTCVPNYSSIKYYIGGSVKRDGTSADLGHCGDKTCGRCFRRNDPHNSGWTGGTEITTVCPTVSSGESVCDLICDADTASCDRYCFPSTPPTLPNGSRYYYAACTDDGHCAIIKDDCKFTVKAWYCGYTYASVQVTRCAG